MEEIFNRVGKLSPAKQLLLEELLSGKGTLAAEAGEIRRNAEEGAYLLSFAQQRLWFLDQLEPGNPFYNVPRVAHLWGELHVPALESSLSEIVRRHAILRTTFQVLNGEPRQIIATSTPPTLLQVDLEHLPEAERELKAKQLVTAEVHRPFDLAVGPLLRTMLVRMRAEEHILLLVLHHIVADGQSIEVFFRELSELYSAALTGRAAALPVLPIQYADYAVWQREWLQGAVLEAQRAYWKQQLAGAPPVVSLPSDYPRPEVQGYRGASLSWQVPVALSEALKELSRQLDMTLFMTLLASFLVVLHRYSGQTDLLVG